MAFIWKENLKALEIKEEYPLFLDFVKFNSVFAKKDQFEDFKGAWKCKDNEDRLQWL